MLKSAREPCGSEEEELQTTALAGQTASLLLLLTKGRFCSLHEKHFAGETNHLSEHPSCSKEGPESQRMSVGTFTDV